MKIKHVKQPTNTSCVSACIAMLTSCDVKIIIEEFHELYSRAEIRPDEFLARHGIVAEPVSILDNQLQFDKIYLVSVPSLNVQAVTHQIIIDLRDDENVMLFDPNQGKKSKKYYTYAKPRSKLGKNEINIRSYNLDYEIIY
jgi:hypothetical protein